MAVPTVAALVLAAGVGTRMGGIGNKVTLPVGGRPILAWSLELFESIDDIGEVVLVVGAAEIDAFQREIVQARQFTKVRQIVPGGKLRHESEYLGLLALAPGIEAGAIDIVLIHDAVRPFPSAELVAKLVDSAVRDGAAIPAVAASETVVAAGAAMISGYPEGLWAAQTPQAFRARPILEAHRRAQKEGWTGTDTASVLEWAGGAVAIVPGSYDNIKITTRADLLRAEQIARKPPGSGSILSSATFGN